MFFKKKHDKSLPDLPPAKIQYPKAIEPPLEDDESIRPLPSFPNSTMHNKFSESMIKNAVSEEENMKTDEKRTLIEMEEWQPEKDEKESPSTPFRPMPDSFKPGFRQSKIDSDVFVKIEKFRSGKRALEEVRGKLEEVDELIKRIREVKMREEQEFSYWEKELMNIKSRVDDVAENIFEKTD